VARKRQAAWASRVTVQGKQGVTKNGGDHRKRAADVSLIKLVKTFRGPQGVQGGITTEKSPGRRRRNSRGTWGELGGAIENDQ